jgi:hypothetical protein
MGPNFVVTRYLENRTSRAWRVLYGRFGLPDSCEGFPDEKHSS